MIGKVKWYNPVKGFGLIRTKIDREKADVFVYYTEIKDEGRTQLKEDDSVEFDLAYKYETPVAINVYTVK